MVKIIILLICVVLMFVAVWLQWKAIRNIEATILLQEKIAVEYDKQMKLYQEQLEINQKRIDLMTSVDAYTKKIQEYKKQALRPGE